MRGARKGIGCGGYLLLLSGGLMFGDGGPPLGS